jgi:CheY-like chemotaxis protein
MKIFVIDDNPHVLALMQRTLEPHGEVEAYHDGAEALQRATAAPPDLIITDYRMKGLDGKSLLTRIKGHAGTKDVPVLIVATRADIDESLQDVAGQVEDFVVKPFYVRDLMQRAKRTLDKLYLARKQSESAASGGAFRGRLSEMNIMDLFQSMEMGAKTCMMIISDGNETGQLYFDSGQVYHCVMGTLKGDAVVNKIAKWTDGTFEVNFTAPRSEEKTTTTGTQGLLMEALRLMDEENK